MHPQVTLVDLKDMSPHNATQIDGYYDSALTFLKHMIFPGRMRPQVKSADLRVMLGPYNVAQINRYYRIWLMVCFKKTNTYNIAVQHTRKNINLARFSTFHNSIDFDTMGGKIIQYLT